MSDQKIKIKEVPELIASSSIPKYNFSVVKILLEGLIDTLLFAPFIHAAVSKKSDSIGVYILYMFMTWMFFCLVEFLALFMYRFLASQINFGGVFGLFGKSFVKTAFLSIAFLFLRWILGYAE